MSKFVEHTYYALLAVAIFVVPHGIASYLSSLV